ncbi:MAG: ATP-dependent Clp protease proteolytic subunit [Acidimicrobiales bacterium]
MTGALGPPWPPEVPPPGPPGQPGRPRPPTYPPVPLVYEGRPLGDQLAERLLDQRRVLVGGRLDLATATDAAARLMLLDGTGDEPIDLMLSCPDGDIIAAMALADTVELVGVELRTLCAGSVGGPAVLPFALGSRRLAQPHASFRFTEPRLDVEGRTTRIVEETARHADLVDDLYRRIAAATGQPVGTIADDFRRHRLLTAPEAKAYGLIDEVQRRLRRV